MPQAIFAYHLGMDAEQYTFFRIPCGFRGALTRRTMAAAA